MPLPTGETFAGYTIVRLLGSGGWVRSTSRNIRGSPDAMRLSCFPAIGPPILTTVPDSAGKPTSTAEHLSLWSDVIAPYKLHPDAVNEIRPRPYLLLGRAGLEAAAHALWLVEAPSPEECAQRHIRLMHRDFTYHRAALAAGGLNTVRIDQRIADLESRAPNLSIQVSPKDKPPGYEKMVRSAAGATSHDENRWAYLWDAASAAPALSWPSASGGRS
jgi:hypothetical protein